jgi:dTDP-glucose pyrophosphorylase
VLSKIEYQREPSKKSNTDAESRLRAATLSPKASIFDALSSIESGALQVAFQLDESFRLVGIVTDGDLRRALLKGASLDSPVAPFIRTEFQSTTPRTGRAAALDLLNSHGIRHLPILDDEQVLLGVHLWSELIQPRLRPNEAVILAGGLGSRLGDLTKEMPKPMLKIAGRPILERLVLHLAGHGIRNIYLAVNYLAQVIEGHFGDGAPFDCKIEYLRESEPLGTGGPLTLLPRDPSHALLVMNGDLLTLFDVDALFAHHHSHKNDITLGSWTYHHRIPFGCLTHEGQRVSDFKEKPSVTRTTAAGIYIVEPDVLKRIPLRRRYDMTTVVEDALRDGLQVGHSEIGDDWVDIGRKEQFDEAREGR